MHFCGGLIYFPEDGGCKCLRNVGKFLPDDGIHLRPFLVMICSYFILPKFQTERKYVLQFQHTRKKIKVFYKPGIYNNKTVASANTAYRKIKKKTLMQINHPKNLISSCCKSKHRASETVLRKAGLNKRIAS